MLFAVVLLGEVITMKGAFGGALIVGAALIASGIFQKDDKQKPQT